jgi:PAS domain S-box-containing protein
VFTIRNTERRRRQIDAFRTKDNAYAVSLAALFACSPDGRFRDVNTAFCEMFGFGSDDDALKAEFCEVFDDEPMAALFERALKGETAGVRLTAQADDADPQDVEVQLAPDVHGKKTVGVVGSVVRI